MNISMSISGTRHLDLGCGTNPRNPYKRQHLFGLDISSDAIGRSESIRSANLAIEKVPFEDDFFDSVSAYDFLEHIPRLLYSHERNSTYLPFVDLMNEVWRILKDKGLFYAMTPAYPHAKAFSDPTHVNIITDKTHTYFTLPQCGAKAYGFRGGFRVLRVKWIRPKYEYEPQQLNLTQTIRKAVDLIKRRNSHLLWEFEAVKP
jgi:SAM-dependent methyltransferase